MSGQPSTPFEERRREVAFEKTMAEIHAWNARGRPATARDRLAQATLRAPIRRAAAAGQLTDREFHKLHGYISALHGYMNRDEDRLIPVEPWSVRRTFREVAA